MTEGAVLSSRETDLGLFRTMALIRRFEEVCQALFRRGMIQGSVHLCMGQEAVSTGVCSVLEPEDRVTATYRGHGQALAQGVEPGRLLAEMLGRRTGVCGGRAGSMNVIDLEHGLVGCYGIVGGSIAAATGVALAMKARGAGVAVAFFGDGAVNQAYFHECLNFAACNRLPVVFVCENNRYMEFTPIENVTAGPILARPRAMEIESRSVDGNDAWAVRDAARWARDRARREGPVFLEALTYRYNDHARGDPIDYRRPGELDEWKARDPLIVGRARLRSEHGVGDDEIDAMLADVGDEAERVRAEAVDAPWPDPPADRGTEFAEAPAVANA